MLSLSGGQEAPARMEDQPLNMLAVVLLLSVLCRINGQNVSITQHPRNDTLCEGSTALLSCTVFDNTTGNTADSTGWFRDGNPPVLLSSNMISNTRNGNVVTSVLSVENVDNGNEYFCIPAFGVTSYVGVISVAGPPDDINDVNISPDTITACSFVVQWNNASSDPVCGSVWYTVTVSTEEGILIITDNTTMTNYNVTGLNDSTVYHVNVTASNNAGSSDSTSMSVMTNSGGLASKPTNITVTALNDRSFTVNWTISDPKYSYTVIWTNLNTSVMDSFTVPENTNSYIVTGLSDNDNYNVSIATMNMCGMTITSDPITVCDLPTATNIRPMPEICVTSFNISWNVSNGITCGDVSYEVSISPPPIEENAVATTDNMFYSVTGLNNSLPNVTVTVTASNKAGQGNSRTILVELPKPLDPPSLYDITTSSSITPADLSGFDIMISWTRPTIDQCTTLPITGYYIHAIVTSRNEDVNERIYTSKYIDDMLGGTMGEFSVSYNASFEQDLEPNANYIFVVNTQNNVIEISRPDTRSFCTDESDDELSTGAAIAISIVVTFIITLVVTALITYIITSLYYTYDLKEKVKVDDDKNVNTKQDPYGGNITMDTNPAYGTTATIKMDTNPAYATTT